MAAEDHATISDRPPAQHVVVAPERDPISGRTSPGDRSNKDNRTDEALRPRSRAKSWRSPALVAAGALVVLASVGAIVAAATGDDRDASRPGATEVEGGAAGSSSPGDQTDTTGTALTTTSPAQPPGGFYGIDVIVGSFYNPIPSNATPSPTSSGSLPFVGVCDGVGPCAIAGSPEDVLIDIDFALGIAMVKLSGVPLTPAGDGAYTYRSSGPRDEFCPIVTEVEFAVQLTATTISGSFSQVPETREILVFDNGSQCWASTFDFTFSGTR